MLFRDVPGLASYFMIYEFIKRNFGVGDNSSESTFMQNLKLFFAGGLAGSLTWTVCYPADYLKTRL